MRVNTNIGDVFSVKLEDQTKYFQYVSNDSTQLNSGVIRGFKRYYSTDESPTLLDIVKGTVEFYAHCNTKLGVKMELWEKVGNEKEIGDLTNVLFRTASDYGRKLVKSPLKYRIDGMFGRLMTKKLHILVNWESNLKTANIGLIINPKGIFELIKGNKYPLEYPD